FVRPPCSARGHKRLLRVYAHRLHSNLMHDLKKLTDESRAEAIAQGMAAMIDGFYIRHALKEPVPERAHIISMVIDFLHGQLEPKDQKDPA
ncbi:MAG: TetR family transcriptional regulator C-terminal domain-containing protein, partial [Pseudomonadota bacterium]